MEIEQKLHTLIQILLYSGCTLIPDKLRDRTSIHKLGIRILLSCYMRFLIHVGDFPYEAKMIIRL